MEKLNQCERIIRHLKDFNSITQAEASAEYGIARLASRINDLKNQGYLIDKQMAKGKNRYGEPTRYAVYKLRENLEENLNV